MPAPFVITDEFTFNSNSDSPIAKATITELNRLADIVLNKHYITDIADYIIVSYRLASALPILMDREDAFAAFDDGIPLLLLYLDISVNCSTTFEVFDTTLRSFVNSIEEAHIGKFSYECACKYSDRLGEWLKANGDSTGDKLIPAIEQGLIRAKQEVATRYKQKADSSRVVEQLAN